MKKNMGNLDRTIRVLVAAIVAVLYLTDQITGTAAIILGVVGVVFMATSLVSSCPLYTVFGLSTRRSE